MQSLIRDFIFNESMRQNIVFSDITKVRLDPKGSGLQLKNNGTDAIPAYSLSANIYARTNIIKPMALYRWTKFEAVSDLPDNTSIKFRLAFGPSAAAQRYWNGLAWVVGGPTDWNTASEINVNIGTLIPPFKDISVFANLATTDPLVTPKLTEIKLLGEFQLEWWNDLIYDTVIRKMISSIQATTDIEFAVSSTTSTIDLFNEYKLDNSGYNFVGVESAYNLTTDPDRFINLFSSYAPGAAKPDGSFEPGVVTLSSPVATGEVLRLTMKHTPEIGVHTNQDYYEPEKIPGIYFENIITFNPLNGTSQVDSEMPGDFIRDYDSGEAIEIGRPRQKSVRMDYVIVTNLQSDEANIQTALDKFCSGNKILKTWGLDEPVRLHHEKSFDTQLPPKSLDDIRISNGSFILIGVPFWLRESKVAPLVLDVNLEITQLEE